MFFGWLRFLLAMSDGSGSGVVACIRGGRGRRGGRRGGGERGRAEKDGGVSGVVKCVCTGHWREARFPRILASFPFFVALVCSVVLFGNSGILNSCCAELFVVANLAIAWWWCRHVQLRT